VCHGNTFFHGIIMEILLISMWPLAVISVRRKDVTPRFCELLWVAHSRRLYLVSCGDVVRIVSALLFITGIFTIFMSEGGV